MRVGMGYDVHKLAEGRPLILGGVHVPYEKGLLGHSDADVLLHAICDALLGAAALGDIGRHFPDTDPEYKGADSMELLKKVRELVEKECYLIENVEAKAGALYRRDEREDRGDTRSRKKTDQRKGNHGRTSGIYRGRTWDQRPGSLHADHRR